MHLCLKAQSLHQGLEQFGVPSADDAEKGPAASKQLAK